MDTINNNNTENVVATLPPGARPSGPRPAPTLAQVESQMRANRSAVTPAPAQLDLASLERTGKLVSLSRRSALSESFRQIKRPLLMNVRQRRAPVQRATLIMVTSALPGEGKTFVAANLAMSLAAEIDTSVLLVDADVIRPALLTRLDVRAGLGLLDVLTRDDLDVDSVVVPTNVPKLSLLPSGTPHPMSTEVLASRAMESLLMTLVARDPNRIVIFDVPPLLVTSEAQVMASRMGQVLMVVEASRTPSTAVAQAFAMLEDCPVVMSVLNKAPESSLTNGYGYYYG